MRIAYVTESFPPVVNGVAVTAMRVAEHLVRRGHEPIVIAPEAAPGSPWPDADFCYPVARMPSVGLPIYPDFRFGLPGPQIKAAIAGHGSDLVHLAGPVFFGASGGAAARKLGLPVVAVYATDMAAYARTYHLGRQGEKFAWWLTRRTHNQCERTLSPSTATAADLVARGFERVSVWGRGVDTDRFDPAKRSEKLRAELAPGGELIVGYIGRIAAEKRLDLLSDVAARPGVKLVVVGGGPNLAIARRQLPKALFLGQRQGEELTRLYASLDIFVHSGPHETFGNTLQEAAASGLPVVAPKAGGPLDIVEDGVTGFLVTPGDGAAIAEAVDALASDWQLRAAAGRAARRSMLVRSWAAKGDELISHYEDVLGRPETAGVVGAAA
ncbi:MAG TPA: glycosyltransferase family 1 protein [Streptosporangiaceae bacterium]|nr:glycosyltransferase family 1 protein [Streptosporangiaceae bacterium]